MKVAFILDSQYPSINRYLKRKCGFRDLFRGRYSHTSIGEMRYRWVSECINRSHSDVQYELYRPGRRYDIVVLMKSMGSEIRNLAKTLRSSGAKIVYDANVDYVTPADGTFYYRGMKPTEKQRKECIEILDIVDAVIADSEHLLNIFSNYCNSSSWISDNVKTDLVPDAYNPAGKVDGKLHLLWSGMACKGFELLVVEDILREFKKHIKLHIIIDSLDGIEMIYDPWQSRIRKLFTDIDVTLETFTSIDDLLRRYALGGIFISPRFLDSTYNLGHTEWKITLPMACGRVILCSPQQSYLTVAQRNLHTGVKICRSKDEWLQALDELLVSRIDWMELAESNQGTVNKHYSTEVVAMQHLKYMNSLQNDLIN